MAPEFAIPAHVEQNVAARALASAHRGSCAGHAGTCTATPTVSRPRYGGRYCPACDPAPGAVRGDQP